MKTKISRYIAIIFFGFLILFLFRIGYGYIYPGSSASYSYSTMPSQIAYDYQKDEQQNATASGETSIDYFGSSRKNYATEKIITKGAGAAPASSEQKYEKVANLTNKSTQFDKDKDAVKTAIQNQKALIQAEQSYGLSGQRNLSLSIGVPPDNFDQLVGDLQKIGTLQSVNINKTDKTNEYKDLQAKRISLEKSRNSLEALRSRSGTIDEQINLQNKILEIEQQVQNLGVRLGEFDSENEFCTVHFLLSERGSAAEISFWYRVRVAFEWSVKYYALGIFCAFLGVLTCLVFVVLVEKLKLLQRTWAALNSEKTNP